VSISNVKFTSVTAAGPGLNFKWRTAEHAEGPALKIKAKLVRFFGPRYEGEIVMVLKTY